MSVKDRSVVDPLNKFDPYHMYASSMEPSKPSNLKAVAFGRGPSYLSERGTASGYLAETRPALWSLGKG